MPNTKVLIDDEVLADRLSCLAITFSYACKAQLRGNSIEDIEEEGYKLVARGVLSQDELDLIATQKAWQPYYCIDTMRETINDGLMKSDSFRENVAHAAMEDTIISLATTIGGCIRVRSTGLPLAYDDTLNAIGVIYFAAACVAWAPAAGLYNPIILLIIYVVAKMIVGVGNDLENPFRHDESDLPLEKFCATVERQILAVHERSGMIRSISKDFLADKEASSDTTSSTATSPDYSRQNSNNLDVAFGHPSETDPLIGTKAFLPVKF